MKRTQAHTSPNGWPAAFKRAVLSAGLAFILGAALAPSSALAACSNNEKGVPGIDGEMEYFSNDVLKYCDGTNWVEMTENDLRTGLVGHWKLDETSGTPVDSSSYGWGSTYPAATPTWAPTAGRVNGAMLFNENNDYVSVNSDSTAIHTATTVTMAFWVKAQIPSTTWTILHRKMDYSVTPTIGWSIQNYNNTGDLFMRIDTSAGTSQVSSNITGVLDNTWHHIVFVIGGGSIIAYKDGVYQHTTAYTQGGGFANTANMVIGRTLKGYTDDFRVYNYALTAAQIEKLYKSTAGGLVGHWKLDDGTGSSTAADATSSHNGTLSASMDPATDWVEGKISKALDFDGISDYISLGDSADFQLTGSMTLSAWIKPDRLTGENSDNNQSIFNKLGNGGSRSYALRMPGDKAEILIAPNASDYIARRTTTALTTGNWYHIVGVYDAAAQTLNMYLNGALDNSSLYGTVGTVPASQFSNNGQPLWIGGRNDNANNNFDGTIDDVRIYKRALSAAEVASLYQCRGPGTYFYNASTDAMQWCDDAYARNMAVPASGSGGCSPEGSLRYNTDRYQFCDGNGWVDVGK